MAAQAAISLYQKGKDKRFFFEKKKQKTFAPAGVGTAAALTHPSSCWRMPASPTFFYCIFVRGEISIGFQNHRSHPHLDESAVQPHAHRDAVSQRNLKVCGSNIAVFFRLNLS
jgi:hypothetical protein